VTDFIVNGMHISMAGRKLTGHDLISAAMAVEIARIVLKHDVSEDQLNRQEPLRG